MPSVRAPDVTCAPLILVPSLKPAAVPVAGNAAPKLLDVPPPPPELVTGSGLATLTGCQPH